MAFKSIIQALNFHPRSLQSLFNLLGPIGPHLAAAWRSASASLTATTDRKWAKKLTQQDSKSFETEEDTEGQLSPLGRDSKSN